MDQDNCSKYKRPITKRIVPNGAVCKLSIGAMSNTKFQVLLNYMTTKFLPGTFGWRVPTIAEGMLSLLTFIN